MSRFILRCRQRPSMRWAESFERLWIDYICVSPYSTRTQSLGKNRKICEQPNVFPQHFNAWIFMSGKVVFSNVHSRKTSLDFLCVRKLPGAGEEILYASADLNNEGVPTPQKVRYIAKQLPIHLCCVKYLANVLEYYHRSWP